MKETLLNNMANYAPSDERPDFISAVHKLTSFEMLLLLRRFARLTRIKPYKPGILNRCGLKD
jgi:hypothetical protein